MSRESIRFKKFFLLRLRHASSIEKFAELYVRQLLDEEESLSKEIFTANRISLRLRGQNIMDAGYIYAPYVPMTVTPATVIRSEEITQIGVRSRYGITTTSSGGLR